MPGSEPRSSVLHHFAAVPHRAFGDKRFKARHFRALGAICIAVDPKTGHALISQRRISRWANISRQYVTGLVRDFENWGYIKRIERGRNQRGKFKTLIYAVQYDAPSPAQATSVGDIAHVTHVSDTTVSPPGAAESDTLNPNIQDEPECTEHPKFAPRGHTGRASAISDENQPVGRQGTNQARNPPVQEGSRRVERGVASDLERRIVAVSRAEGIERGNQNAAEKRICDGLFKAFPGDKAPDALEALNRELYETAIDAEMRRHGAGISMVVRAVKRTMSRRT